MTSTESKLSDLNRFMRLVEIQERTDCWEWIGNRPSGKYGHFSVGLKAVKAHRWVYELCCGQIPDDMVIRHKCDNPACVNPLHLTIGTGLENVRDRVERNRSADRKGEKHPLAKLGAPEVLELRRLASLGHTARSLAEQFGISNQQAGKIIRRENWRHI